MPEKVSRSTVHPTVVGVCVLAAGVGVMLHVAFAYLIAHGLYGQWWVAAVAVIAFTLLYGICAFVGAVITGRWPILIMTVLIAASIFVCGLSWSVLCGFVVECLGFMVFTIAIQREAANRIKLSLAHVMAYRSTFGIALGLAAVSCVFYGVMNASISSGQFQESIVSAGVAVVNETAKTTIPPYDPSMTVDALIRQQIPTPSDLVRDINLSAVPATTVSDLERRLSDAGIDPALIDLNAVLSNRTEQERALTAQVDLKFKDLSQAIVDASRQQLSNSIGMQLDGNARVEDAVRDLLRERVTHFTLPQLRFAPLILATTFFLTLMLFNWLFALLAILFARILLFMGIHSSIVTVTDETVTASRYRLT